MVKIAIYRQNLQKSPDKTNGKQLHRLNRARKPSLNTSHCMAPIYTDAPVVSTER